MKRIWALGLILLPAALVSLHVDAASGICRAPSPEGCKAPTFWVDLRAGQPDEVSPTVVSASVPMQPPVARVPLPPIGSGAGAPMVMDEGMGRQEVKPDDSQARMMRTAGKAAALRGEGIKEDFASDLNYLQGYANGQIERSMGGVRP